jgi:hypothetical protein
VAIGKVATLTGKMRFRMARSGVEEIRRRQRRKFPGGDGKKISGDDEYERL